MHLKSKIAIVSLSCLCIGSGGGLVYLSAYLRNQLDKIDDALLLMYQSVPRDIFSLKDFNFVHNAFSKDLNNPALSIRSFKDLDQYIKHAKENISITDKNMAEFLKYIEEYSKNHPDQKSAHMDELLDLIKQNSKTFDKVNSQASRETGWQVASALGISAIGIGLLIFAVYYAFNRKDYDIDKNLDGIDVTSNNKDNSNKNNSKT